MKLQSINDILWAARLAVNNTAKDTEVAKKLGQFGFPARRMQEGKDLLTVVQEMEQAKKTCYNERWDISHQIEQELLSIRPVFREHVTAVRFVFRHEPTILRSLNVRRIANNQWTWVEQARSFYELLAPYRSQLATHGVAPEELDQAQASLEAVLVLRDDRLHKKGEAEDCTQSRNQASDMLRSWLREFHTAARLALKDTPQKLEAYGINVPSVQR